MQQHRQNLRTLRQARKVRERRKLWYHLCVECRKAKLTEKDNRMVVARGWGLEGKGEMLFKGINMQLVEKSQRSNAEHSEYRHYWIIIKLTKKLNFNYSYNKQEMIIMWHDREANYLYNDNHVRIYQIPYQHAVYLKFAQCYLSNIFQ